MEAITVRFRTGFTYVAAELPGEESLPLCRLRFTGVPHTWGFALYLADSDSYRDNILPSGLPAGSPEEALDCAGDLYLNALAPVIRVPTGLVVLVGPPASGKTSFVRALVARRQINPEAVVSSDEIRAELVRLHCSVPPSQRSCWASPTMMPSGPRR
ncbi:AAA family ATPase [Streptomyces coeruleorubidus]|uniref:AAA family ATPase n=1 Tax=Streptomyces coeruleorubidus TaxID=116188 RepID=UPI0037BDE847